MAGYTTSGTSNARKIAALAVLLVLLAVAAYLVYYFTLNRSLPVPRTARTAQEAIPAPEFLYAISGTGANGLGRPIGVAFSKDGNLFISDVTRSRISVFTKAGKYLFSFDKIADGKNTKLKAPVHLAFDEKGELFVSDRTLDAVYVFDATGKYLRKFTPTDASISKKWSPLAVTFDDRGRLYLSDVGDTANHKLLVFDRSGAKLLQWGKTAQVNQMTDSPGDFYFPNGIAVSRTGLVFVADGNNRRVQVFDTNGKYQYLIATSGIPRGIWVDDADKRLIVSDALSQQVDVYGFKGEKLTSFGEGGVGAGQFQYPNDVTMDAQGRIYVADRENHQVQVWGWPQAAVPAAVASAASRWYLCLPLLLLPLLLFLLGRRRDFVVTPGFVDALVAAEDVPAMQIRRVRWVSPETDHATFYEGRTESGIDLGALISAMPHSDSDARDLMEKLRTDEATAILLSMAKRAGRLATEDDEIHRLAVLLGVQVFDRAAFIQEFGSGRS